MWISLIKLANIRTMDMYNQLSMDWFTEIYD